AQVAPVRVGQDDQGHVPVGGRVHVVGHEGAAAVAVAGAGRHAVAVPTRQARGEGGEHRVDHGDVHDAAPPRALALVERGHDPGVEVRAPEEVGEGDARLDRRVIGEAGHAHDAGVRLDGEVHGQRVAVGTVDAVAGGRAVDEPGVAGQQR